MKTCTVCKQAQSLENFYSRKSAKDGKGYRCKICDNKARLKWQSDNPEKAHTSQRGRNLKHKYGVDLVWYEEQLKKQNYSCAICGIKENKVDRGGRAELSFAVDHCHTTGKVRGLLCNQCNRALGMFKDSIELINNAIDYLRKRHTDD